MILDPTLEARPDIRSESIRPRLSIYIDMTVSLSELLPSNNRFRFSESLWKLSYYNNRPLRIADLGWTHAQAGATRARFEAFEEDWDAPGMESYDAL